jgi:hypothetical protein
MLLHGTQFPAAYRNQVFIAEHGSWNRSKKIGYRITQVRLDAVGRRCPMSLAEGWLTTESGCMGPACGRAGCARRLAIGVR